MTYYIIKKENRRVEKLLIYKRNLSIYTTILITVIGVIIFIKIFMLNTKTALAFLGALMTYGPIFIAKYRDTQRKNPDKIYLNQWILIWLSGMTGFILTAWIYMTGELFHLFILDPFMQYVFNTINTMVFLYIFLQPIGARGHNESQG